jgi:hypothetical protein
MKLYLFLAYTSIFITVLVAFFYRQNKMNFFFILLAINDIIGIIASSFFSLSGQIFWIPINYLLLFSIHKQLWEKLKWLIILGIIPVIILNYFSSAQHQHYIVLFVNLFLISVFIKRFITGIISQNQISLFYFGLILLESIVIFNFVALLKDIKFGLNVYFAGLIGMIIIKIFLIIIRDGVSIKLKHPDL